jgi:hypothetical protein
MEFHIARRRPIPTPGFNVYWSFAAERQQMYRRRLEGHIGPLTSDIVLANNRFTNAYRAADRVSQYLITKVIYDSNRSWIDTFTRILVFKIFNRVDTWEHLLSAVGEVSADQLLSGRLDDALEDRAARMPLYSAAYIMPPPRNRTGPKFRRHLGLLRDMLIGGAHERIAEADNMADAYRALIAYESIGPFLSYQFLTDLNYSAHLDFTETEFVVPGPGALRGMRKCIAEPGDFSPPDVIRWTMDAQASAFRERELAWMDLWGRELQLIDIQNLFCEVDKYTREAHPELSCHAPGKRIKQRYRAVLTPLTAWFPPKWGLNDSIPVEFAGGVNQRGNDQLELFQSPSEPVADSTPSRRRVASPVSPRLAPLSSR